MDSKTRLDKRIAQKFEDGDVAVKLSPTIKNNLRHTPRPYQIEAFTAFDYYMHNPKLRTTPTHVLFHMATGSGKTMVMAGAMLELYKQGYRNFIFFVNTDTIIRKTKENFLNPNSSKYLFADTINIEGVRVQINSVDNFESVNDTDINILFSTIQGLHSRLNAPRENSITFDDFTDKKVVLISDEAHHINALTKKKLSKTEQLSHNSWEYTVDRILQSSPSNVMMDFTATIELSHPAVASKYNNKLLYNYPLAKFREDGYSKEVKTNQVDYEPIQRALVAILISQYKKKIFASNGILAKPVILFKSKTVAESGEMEEAITNAVRDLNVKQLKILIKLDNAILSEAMDYFTSLDISYQGLIDELKDDFDEEKIISVNSKNDTNEKQIVINSLEDDSNEYRAVFAVDKLNEGWDVLNLYDIVRLYDSRDAKDGKPGKTTVAEAQLIGRGARYYPFTLEAEQEIDKRKYDNDANNILRNCETLHYHCSHNVRYINELNNALKQIGLFPDEKIEVDLLLKDDFKATDLYKHGFIWLNNKVKKEADNFMEYQAPTITYNHTYQLYTKQSDSTTILAEGKPIKNKVVATSVQRHSFKTWSTQLIQKGLNKLPFYRFSTVKGYFPKVNSMNEFITKDEYLGGITVEVSGLKKDTKDLSVEDKLKIVVSVASKIANEVSINYGSHYGTKSFERVAVKKVFRDKKLSFAINNSTFAETGKATMRPNIDPKFFVDLNKADWYAYHENFGSSEEKFLVKYIESKLDDLKKRFTDIYLLRNERFFKLYRFSDDGTRHTKRNCISIIYRT
jgi:type III restriction enzyme